MWCIPFSQTGLGKLNHNTTEFRDIELQLHNHYTQGNGNITTYFHKAKIWQYMYYTWYGRKDFMFVQALSAIDSTINMAVSQQILYIYWAYYGKYDV
jgi:hypothetical protein